MSEIDNMTQDPVCDAPVDKTGTEFSYEYDGEVYFFCSTECKTHFEVDPRSYIHPHAA